MSNAVHANTAPDDASSKLEDALNTCDGRLMDLEDAIARLTSRLSPIMRPADPEEADKESTAERSCSAVVYEVHRTIDRLDRLIKEIQVLNSRLEV